jgi:hypothetical protein
MSLKKPNIELREHELSAAHLARLKWCTTLAIIGLPVMIQILGAVMLFSSQYPALKSAPAVILCGVGFAAVIAAGLYAISNRVFLRFSGANKGLKEWEERVQSDAFAFSYRMIARGVLIAFIGVSALGIWQLMQSLGWVSAARGPSIVLRSEGLAALTVTLTYLVLLLPTLYIAWTLSPLEAED